MGMPKRRLLDYEQRKSIAEQMVKGLMLKQVAADNNITYMYAYKIFYEFLEWKVGWKRKNE